MILTFEEAQADKARIFAAEPSGFGLVNNPDAVRAKRLNEAKRVRRRMVRESRRQNRRRA